MPSTDPATISGYQAGYSLDADALAGADGSSVSSLGSYGVSGGAPVPTLKHNAVASRKALAFAGGQRLIASVPTHSSPPVGNLSGGGFPDGFTAIAVVKFTSLAALAEGFAGDRRAFFAFRDGTNAGGGAWSVTLAGKQRPTMQHFIWGGLWGETGPTPFATIFANKWAVIGLRTNGQTMTSWKGLSLDRTATNTAYPDYSQFITHLLLGGDLAFPTQRYFTGEVAYLSVYDRAITDQQYLDAAAWLLDRYGLLAREIAVTGRIGTVGKDLLLTFTSAESGAFAYVAGGTVVDPSKIRYRVNGGSEVTPTVVHFDDWGSDTLRLAGCGVELSTPVSGSDVVTYSLLQGVATTNLGAVEDRADQPVTNHAGQFSMLAQNLDGLPTPTMKVGYNVNTIGQYWNTDCGLKNLVKGASQSPGVIDANGWTISNDGSIEWILRIGSNNASTHNKLVMFDHPEGARFGRYVVSWETAGNAVLALETTQYDAGQTSITHVPELDSLSGTSRKRYYDVAPAGGAIRYRPDMKVRVVAGSLATNVDVRLASYEGESGHFCDEWIERLNGVAVVRTMDFTQTNNSSIGRPQDFCPMSWAVWNPNWFETHTITRIESWGGPYYSDSTNRLHFKVTFAAPHGMVSQQGFQILAANADPINVVLADRTVAFANQWCVIAAVLSPTEVYGWYWMGATTATVTPYTGANATARLSITPGAPPALQAHLVNESGVPALHVTVPCPCDDATVAYMADQIAAVIEPTKEVWVEWGNEVWNPAFGQYATAATEAVRRGIEAYPGENTSKIVVVRTLECYDVFRARWTAAGKDPNKIRCYIAGWYVQPSRTQVAVDYLLANRPSLPFIFAVAPYGQAMAMGRKAGVDYASWTLERMLDYQEHQVLSYSAAEYIALHKAILDASGLTYELAAYEDQITPAWFTPGVANPDIDVRYESANREFYCSNYHPRTYGITLRHMRNCQATGVKYNEVYGLSNLWVNEGDQPKTKYGDFIGLAARAGKGDGSGGHPDNRPLLVDENGLVQWPNTPPIVNPQAGARKLWMLATAGGGASPSTMEPTLWRKMFNLTIGA